MRYSSMLCLIALLQGCGSEEPLTCSNAGVSTAVVDAARNRLITNATRSGMRQEQQQRAVQAIRMLPLKLVNVSVLSGEAGKEQRCAGVIDVTAGASEEKIRVNYSLKPIQQEPGFSLDVQW